VPVTIPEPMSIYEIERLVLLLEKARIPVNSIIANRIIIEDNKCNFCLARKKEQEKYIKEIEKKFASYNLIKMPLFPGEIRGLKDLALYGEILFGKNGHKPYLASNKSLVRISPIPQGGMDDLLDKNLKIIIFGGKGGVGKTSIASASALQLARHNKDKKFSFFQLTR